MVCLGVSGGLLSQNIVKDADYDGRGLRLSKVALKVAFGAFRRFHVLIILRKRA